MKMILRNIRDFAKNHIGFFLLIVFSVFASSTIMLFAFGAYQNFHLAKEEYTNDQLQYSVRFYERDEETHERTQAYNVTKAEIMQCIESLSDDTLNDITSIYVISVDESGMYGSIDSRFIYRNGKYIGSQTVAENLKKFSSNVGRYYTDYEYSCGDSLALAPKLMLNENGKLQLQGKEFEAVMIGDNILLDVVYTALSPDTLTQDICFDFVSPLTSMQYNDITNIFKRILGNRAVLSPPEPISAEQYYLYDTIIMVSILIAIAASVNIAILYCYILTKRQKSLAVFMLCGCTKAKAAGLYIGESLILTIPLFALCSVIFHFILMPVLENTALPFIATAYSFKLYTLAFVIYISMCTIGMLALSAFIIKKQSIVRMKGAGV